MIPILVKVESTTRFGREAWRDISKETWSEVGDKWHEEILPRHFDLSAMAEYGYAPRTRKYMIQKASAKGHQNPLTYKGDLQAQVTRLRDVSAISSRGSDEGGVNVRVSGPRYLHQRPQPGQPNLAAELSAVSQRDADALAAFMDERITEKLNEDGEPKEIAPQGGPT